MTLVPPAGTFCRPSGARGPGVGTELALSLVVALL